MKYYITGTRRGLGKALKEKHGNCNSLDECDIFINCKHEGFSQVDLLYYAAEKHKQIINIGSNSPDEQKHQPHVYAIQKAALDLANEQLFYQGVNTTIIRLGYFDTERVAHINKNKMSVDYVVKTIDWIINQPHRVKELTVIPK